MPPHAPLEANEKGTVPGLTLSPGSYWLPRSQTSCLPPFSPPSVLFPKLRTAALLEHKASLQPRGLAWGGVAVTRSLMASLGPDGWDGGKNPRDGLQVPVRRPRSDATRHNEHQTHMAPSAATKQTPGSKAPTRGRAQRPAATHGALLAGEPWLHTYPVSPCLQSIC